MASPDSTTSGERSLSSSPSTSLSPRSSVPFPSLAFAGAMTVPLKASVSPPSTTSSDLSWSLSPTARVPARSDSSYKNCAYPDWPKRGSLSPVTFSGSSVDSEANSYISDEDLLDLAQLPLCNDIRVLPGRLAYDHFTAEISWETTGQPPVALSLPVTRKIPATPKRRRRSSPLKRRKLVLGMSPIAEGADAPVVSVDGQQNNFVRCQKFALRTRRLSYVTGETAQHDASILNVGSGKSEYQQLRSPWTTWTASRAIELALFPHDLASFA